MLWGKPKTKHFISAQQMSKNDVKEEGTGEEPMEGRALAAALYQAASPVMPFSLPGPCQQIETHNKESESQQGCSSPEQDMLKNVNYFKRPCGTRKTEKREIQLFRVLNIQWEISSVICLCPQPS